MILVYALNAVCLKGKNAVSVCTGVTSIICKDT